MAAFGISYSIHVSRTCDTAFQPKMLTPLLSDRGKAFGRGGGGAVFGSKNLYAIAVLPGPEKAIEVANEDEFAA